MKKTDKILVTGASGFIGSRLLKMLYENGYTNLRATTFARDLRNDFTGTQFVEHIKGDLQTAEFCEKIVQNIDVVTNQSKIAANTIDSVILKVLVASPSINGSLTNTAILGGKTKYGYVSVNSNDPVANTVTLNVTPFVLANVSMQTFDFSSYSSKMNYMKVGNMVFFSGNLGLVSSSQGSISSVDIPLPITSAFTNSMDAVGVITSIVGATGIIEANTGSTKYLKLRFRSDINQQMYVAYFSGSYIVK